MLSRIHKGINLKRTTTLVVSLFVVVFLFLAMTSVSAQIGAPDSGGDLLGLQPVGDTILLSGADIRLIIARVIRAVLGLLGIIAISIMLYAGFVIMTSDGNEEKIAQGKKIMVNGVIGLAIILSSFAIVQFVINALVDATGLGGTSTPSKPKIETFAGSGSLGKIIKDHYPERDQTEVKRNTMVVVTFAEPMDPSTVVDNNNNTCWPVDGGDVGVVANEDESNCLKDEDGDTLYYYGDCLKDVENFDWKEHCDHILQDSVEIYFSENGGKDLIEAAGLTVYEDGAQKNSYNFIFKPFDPLGDNVEDVWHTVRLNKQITKKDGVGAFDGQHYQYYTWEFQTDTLFDFEPPFVESVYPDNIEVPRNTIVQINFNEPMNPLVVQGQLSAGSSFYNMIFDNSEIGGEWKISNGYRTAEFVSDQPCGLNSCGDMMYCLEVDCEPGDKTCGDLYTTLIRTAELMPGGESFQSEPFSGVMDLAGNALDSDKDGVPDGKPIMVPDEQGGFKNLGEQEMSPDNYWWKFNVLNVIDRSAPHVESVSPGLDEGGVEEDAAVAIQFNRGMWSYTLKEIELEEHPDEEEVDFWFYIRSKLVDGKSKAIIEHRKFGPNGIDYYYFPKTPSQVKSLNQNCLYPGRGPTTDEDGAGTSPDCIITEYNENGSPVNVPSTCVSVNTASSTDTGCIQTVDYIVNNEGEKELLQAQPDIPTCAEYLRDISS